MSRDNCLKSFIPYDHQDDDAFERNLGLGNSCWVDSLFVALFHTFKNSIDKFVDNLEIKKYLNIPDYDKKKLEEYENRIIINIRNIYHIINIDNGEKFEKVQICNNMRKTLEKHRKILIKNNIITDLDPDFNSFLFLNSSYELLKYLKEYVLDEQSFNSIELNEIILFHNDTLNNKFNFLSYNNINFINIKYGLNSKTRSSFFTDSNKIKDNLFDLYLHLHSIIIHDGAHYTCYYKCEGKWYFYNDIIKNSKKRTRLVGSLEDVMNDHNSRFDKFEGDYEMTLLYLKNEVGRQGQGQTQASRSEVGRQGQGQSQATRSEVGRQGPVKELTQGAISQQADTRDRQLAIDEQIDISEQSALLAMYEKKKIDSARRQAYATRSEVGRQGPVKELTQATRSLQAAKTKETKQERREQERSDEQERREQERSDEQLARKLLTEIEDNFEEEEKAREREETKKANEKSLELTISRVRQELAERDREATRDRQAAINQQSVRDRQAVINQQSARDRQLALQIQRKEEQENKDRQYAEQLQQKYYNQYGSGIRIINDRCNTTIKNINDSNCNQKLQKIQKIEYVRNELIEDTNRFFNKKINKLKL